MTPFICNEGGCDKEFAIFDLEDHYDDTPLAGFTIDTDIDLSDDIDRIEHIVFLEAYARGGAV